METGDWSYSGVVPLFCQALILYTANERGLAPFGSKAKTSSSCVEKGACPRMQVCSRKKRLLPRILNYLKPTSGDRPLSLRSCSKRLALLPKDASPLPSGISNQCLYFLFSHGIHVNSSDDDNPLNHQLYKGIHSHQI